MRAAGVFAVLLTMVLTSGGCGRSEKKGQIIVTPTPTVSDGGKVSKSPKEQAMDAYREILTAAPAIAGAQDILADITLRYEQNLEMFGDHVERYAYYDLNRDEIPELIALSVVNARWTPVSVYTYADGKAVLLEDPSDPEAHGTFEQSSLSNGAYLLYFCKENHIHNVWRGSRPSTSPESVILPRMSGGALKIGDKYYFADPTWDYTSDPLLYRYFCFGLDQREADGYPEDKMSLCCCGDFKMSDYVTIERKGYE